MIIYIVILIFVYFIWLSGSNKLNKTDIFFFTFLTFVSGFRYGVGTDFFNYVDIFDYVKLGYEISVEPGFVLLSTLLVKMNLNSQALFLILSTLSMMFLYNGIKFYVNKDYLFKPVLYIIMLIYVFIPSLNVVRQILSAAIMLYASRYIINKNFLKYIIWVFFASLFHSSSLIFIVLYFLVDKNFKKISLLIMFILSIIMAELEVFTKLLNYILNNFAFLDINNYISDYLYSSYNDTEVELGTVYYIQFFVLILFIFLKDRLIINTTSLVAFNFFYLYILSIILSVDAYVFNRFNYYFGIYMAISISRFSIIFDTKSKRIVEYTMLSLYTVLYLYIILFVPGHDIIPYDFNLNLFD